MVDVTPCVRCGRMIPALDTGCAYCEALEPQRPEKPYLPLAIKLLLWLFAGVAASTALLAILTMVRNAGSALSDSVLVVLAALRFLAAAMAAFSVVTSPSWGRVPCLVFVGLEILSAAAIQIGWLAADRWAGGVVAPLWTVVFVFLFFRQDVAARFDPRIADRSEVGALLRSLEDEARR